MIFRRFRTRGGRIPPALLSALTDADRLLAGARTADGGTIAATRFGLWLVAGEVAERWEWHLISKARLAGGAMYVTVADVVETWPDGALLVRDRPEIVLRPGYSTRLTDVVHERVRRSVAASSRLDWPAAGAWVALRRVAGHDGLVVQVRLDPASDAAAPGFSAAVQSVVREIWPSDVPGGPQPAHREDESGEDRP